jgi:hypothetical protein
MHCDEVLTAAEDGKQNCPGANRADVCETFAGGQTLVGITDLIWHNYLCSSINVAPAVRFQAAIVPSPSLCSSQKVTQVTTALGQRSLAFYSEPLLQTMHQVPCMPVDFNVPQSLASVGEEDLASRPPITVGGHMPQ